MSKGGWELPLAFVREEETTKYDLTRLARDKAGEVSFHTPIQLTGRNNYRAAGRFLGLDLLSHPQRAADPDVGFRVAGWYWTSRGLNALADSRRFDDITRKINGGLNGKAERDRYYAVARQVLGAG